ncbi:MAG TPA: CAP domain-containing protein [Chitinophagaceae bacterium]|nr:CAP domain-containing protein [Chitinophagaceae bacterium]
MLRFVLSTLILGGIAWSCTKGMAAATDEPAEIVNSFNVNSTAILEAVNNVRQKGCNCGGVKMPPVPPVTWNNQLAQAAYNHSKEMHAKRFFNHNSRNGASPGDRIRAAGYTWKAYGENIALHNTDEAGVVDGWLRSPSHCKTIMSPLYKEMGVGRSGSYWTQDFGAK